MKPDARVESASATVTVWWCNLNNVANNMIDNLSVAEKHRCWQLIFPEQQQQCWRARAFLRWVLSHYVAVAPAEVCLTKAPSGKPMLSSSHARVVHFNLSHSAQWAVCAVTAAAPLGIDIEVHRPLHDMATLAARVLSPLDYRMFLQQDTVTRQAIFFEAWTRHEAVQKMVGTTGQVVPHQLLPLACPLAVSGHLAVQSSTAFVVVVKSFAS